ncbi:MAG: hypothetical protein J5829_06795 [Lachnospiraceae bacterium]|nr:hypothetical protein [Lachnospiraceae bacterium]
MKKTAAAVLSLILVLTAHPLSVSYGSEDLHGLAVSEDAISRNDLSDNKTAPDEAVSDNKTVPGETVSEDSSSGENAGEETISDNTVSGDTVSGDSASENDISFEIPFGAFDDDMEIENPDPLPEFETPASEGDEGMSIMAIKAPEPVPYAVSYNGAAEGLLPDALRHQGSSSLCWSFSAALLAEVSMIKNSLAPKSVHYSEDQIGYFFYHHAVDPLGGTVGDETFPVPSSADYYHKGGNNVFNVWSLAAWVPVRDQADMPFKNRPYTVSEVTPDLAYNSVAHMQNSYWSSMESTGDDISYIENVKELVYRFGAASVIIYSGLSINKNHAVYNTYPGSGHNVSIVGWDDNYSAEKFTTRPAGDGAWYVRDNYGTDGNRDENGCFWMSYYDKSLRRTNNKAIAFEFESGDNYDNNYQYDGSCGNSTQPWNGSTGIAANVFTAQKDEVLEAAGFAPANAEVDYTVRIYKLVSADDAPDSGEKVSEVSGSTRYYGYRTIPLKDKVSLSAGQAYSVWVRTVAKNENASMFVDMDNDSNSWISFHPSSSANQSYAKFGSDWYDMHSTNKGNETVRIKAYTNDADDMYASYELLDTDDYTYDGSTEHRVKVTVSGADGMPRSEGVDYSVTYLNNIEPGKARVSVNSLKGESLGNRYFTYDIKPRTVSEGFVSTISGCVYTGSAQKPAVTLSDDALGQLKKGVDYLVKYSDNINAGIGHVTFTGTGRYTGSITREFVIEPKQANFEISSVTKCVYTGKEQKPSVTVSDPGIGSLTEGEDYTAAYSQNINAGKGRIILNGCGNYKGSVTGYFDIMPKPASYFVIDDIPPAQYTGEELKPEPVVKDRELQTLLKRDIDYTVSYNKNINEGNASVYINGEGNYSGSVSKNFFISAAPVKELKIKPIKNIRFSPGEPDVRPKLEVTCDGYTLLEGRDYTASYVNNDRAGTATVSISGISRTLYDNSRAEAQFTILPYSLKNASIEGIGDRLHETGKDWSLAGLSANVLAVRASTGESVRLRQGIDYEIVFDENTKIPAKSGKKVVYYIKGIGDYTGSVKKSFTVRDYIPLSDTDYFEITLSKDTYTYDGEYHRPMVTVRWKQDGDPTKAAALTEGIDYSCSYSNNKNAGRACIKIKPLSSLKKHRIGGSATVRFTIIPTKRDGCYINPIKDLTYNSKARKPSVAVYDMSEGKRLKSSQYFLIYEDNIRAGTAKVTAYGKNNYTGLLCSRTFNILPQSFGKVELKYRYDRNAGQFRYFRVCYGKSVLRENIDYTISESGPGKDGKTVRTVTAIEGRDFLDDVTKSMKYKK